MVIAPIADCNAQSENIDEVPVDAKKLRGKKAPPLQDIPSVRLASVGVNIFASDGTTVKHYVFWTDSLFPFPRVGELSTFDLPEGIVAGRVVDLERKYFLDLKNVYKARYVVNIFVRLPDESPKNDSVKTTF